MISASFSKEIPGMLNLSGQQDWQHGRGVGRETCEPGITRLRGTFLQCFSPTKMRSTVDA